MWVFSIRNEKLYRIWISLNEKINFQHSTHRLRSSCKHLNMKYHSSNLKFECGYTACLSVFFIYIRVLLCWKLIKISFQMNPLGNSINFGFFFFFLSVFLDSLRTFHYIQTPSTIDQNYLCKYSRLNSQICIHWQMCKLL